MLQTLRQLDDLALPFHVKINLIVTFRCMIDGLLQIQEGSDYLKWQGIADPHAYEESYERYDSQCPFRLTNKMPGFGMTFLYTTPVHRF